MAGGPHLRREQLRRKDERRGIGAGVHEHVEEDKAGEDRERGLPARALDGGAVGEDDQPERHAREADHLQRDAPPPVDQPHVEQESDDQEEVEERRALGGQEIARDGAAAWRAERERGQDRGREDADGVGGDVHEEPPGEGLMSITMIGSATAMMSRSNPSRKTPSRRSRSPRLLAPWRREDSMAGWYDRGAVAPSGRAKADTFHRGQREDR